MQQYVPFQAFLIPIQAPSENLWNVLTVSQIMKVPIFRFLSPLEQEASFTHWPLRIGPLASRSSLGEFTSHCWAEDQMWCPSPGLPNTVRRILRKGTPVYRAALSLPGGNITQLSPARRLLAKEPAVKRGSLSAQRRRRPVVFRPGGTPLICKALEWRMILQSWMRTLTGILLCYISCIKKCTRIVQNSKTPLLFQM